MTALTVVVTTDGGVGTLGQVLDGLEDQTASRDLFDVVVVDDGSEDGTADRCRHWEDGARRRYVRQRRCGRAFAQNLGVLMASAPLVLLIDDDELPRRSLVEEHLRAHRAVGAFEVVVVGRSGWSPDLERTSLLRFLEGADPLPFAYPATPRQVRPGLTSLRSRHVSFQRSFLSQRGLFDARFEPLADVELACRLRWHGLRLHYWSHARTDRLTTVTFDEWRDQVRLEGRAAAMVAAHHAWPEVHACAWVTSARADWAAARDMYGDLCARVRRLEAELDPNLPARSDQDLLPLWRAYWRCFAASRAHGVAEGLALLDAVSEEPSR